LVSDVTAEKVRFALRETGYVPNKQAGQLASGRSNMVAALVPNLANSIFAETVQGLSDGLQEAGLELMLASTTYSMEREEEQLRAVLGWFPSAIVITGRHHTHGTLKLLNSARTAGTPVIQIFDHHLGESEEGYTQIGFNHEQVGRDMAGHLLARGHRRLAYVDSGVPEDFRAHERGNGFLAAVSANGAATAELLRAPAGDVFDAGRQMLRLLQQQHAEVTGVAFANDNLACGALLEAQACNVAVPGSLALLGFGDVAIGRQLQPGLSTVSPPRYDVGRAAAKSLLGELREGMPMPHIALPWQLIARGST
jgi:LacI family gluconate utilization system Gnt-I transcriptional repressor